MGIPEKLDPDFWASKLLDFLSPYLNVGTTRAKEQFSSHFFSNATITLLILSVPWRWSFIPALIPIILAAWQELIRDGHWKDFFKNNDEGKDGRTDLLSRGLGATLPFLTLFWK